MSTPTATYRLQFNSDFTFGDAAALIPYLHALGVSHCYASPYLKARTGSPHGYDIVDHNALNPEIGGEAAFAHFSRALRAHGMGQILDLVPNHMGVGGSDNHWWLDLLENGPAAEGALFFDVDWRPVKEALRGKVLVPLLGGHYGEELEAGRLRLRFDADAGCFSVYYYEHRFPIDPRSYPQILDTVTSTDDEMAILQRLSTGFSQLPTRDSDTPALLQRRRRRAARYKRALAHLCSSSSSLKVAIIAALSNINGEPGRPDSFNTLHTLLEAQAYRVAYWLVAADEINYRRFFDINDLAGLRMEEPRVLDATHQLVQRLYAAGEIDGIRLDHPDGLHNPHQYFHRLRHLLRHKDESAPYLLVEKILAPHESLPEAWPVAGTTGYDFLNFLSGLFVWPDAERPLTRLYHRFTGCETDFSELLYHAKRLVIRIQLSSELTVLANLLDSIAQSDRHTRDFTLNGLREALSEVAACFPVYRTYVTGEAISETDRHHVTWAVAKAKQRSAAADTGIFDLLQQTLLPDGESRLAPVTRALAVRFAMKFQQFTAPVTAKALEDTAFYRFYRLVSLNEVGGDPARFGTTPATFHHANQARAEQWPDGMTTTSTHDTKRSEDVRCRIHLLSEIPETWARHVRRWARLNSGRKQNIEGESAPSRNDEYLFYQTLFGIWPLQSLTPALRARLQERLSAYMVKAAREAKHNTSWLNPNRAYEQATEQFVQSVLADREPNRFLDDFLQFQQPLVPCGLFNSLSQTALKLLSPGVPDIYQGCELWSFSLVDPDNRRPVDYTLRKRIVAEPPRPWPVLLQHLDDGRAKLHLTRTLLRLRQRLPGLFARGNYLPLQCTGTRAEHLCAFAREMEEQMVIVVAGRWFARLGLPKHGVPLPESLWEGTELQLPESPGTADGVFYNLLADRTLQGRQLSRGWRLPVADLLAGGPVAVLLAPPSALEWHRPDTP